jgi:hypothetical protein
MNPFLFAEQQISALADDLIRYKKSWKIYLQMKRHVVYCTCQR